MQCRGKCLQLAALLLAVACGPAAGAAVHRARGVDFITAQLIGSSVSSHVRQSGVESPNAHFSRDAWQPVQEDSRDLVPQPRAAETEAVVVSTELKTKPNDDSKRGPEVEDSIAAVASQLLNNPQPVLDVRTPPAKKQEPEASQDKKWQQMQTMQKNSDITVKGTAQTPLVVSNSGPTRFPPRVPSTPSSVNTTTSTKKPPVVVLEKQTTTPAPVTKVSTTAQPKTTATPPKPTRKEPVTPTPATTTTPKPTTAVKKVEQLAKRPAVSSFTVLNRIEPTSSTPKSVPTTTKRAPTTTRPAPTTAKSVPVTVVTESIPTAAATAKPNLAPVATVKPTTGKPPKKPYRPPSASVVTRPPQAISTFIPDTFEILSTERPTTKVLTTTTTTTTPAPTTTTTTPAPTSAPVTEKTKKKKNKKNKNKKRRRRPSTKPENKIDELEEKEDKPLSSRIIDYLSVEGIPSFGTTMVGLLMTAGLAGLFFFPMEGFTRRSDHFKREDENEGLMPSILKAVYTSIHPVPENDLHTEEQGPRRFRRSLHRRSKRQYRFERVPYRPVPPHLRSPMYRQEPAESTNIMQIEASNQPFSLVRLVKQMLAVKLDVLSNVLRMASEQLRNYAQNAEVQRPPKPSTTTTTAEPATEASTDVEAETTEVPSEEKAQTTVASTTSTSTTTTEPLNDEENLIRRRTAD